MNKDFQKKGSKFKTSRDVLQEKTIKKEFFWSKERYCNKKIIPVFFIHVSIIDIPNIDVFCRFRARKIGKPQVFVTLVELLN